MNAAGPTTIGLGAGARVPRVSVIIPAFNASSTICRAVDSALAQTFTDHEVIVVDDGSTDDTRARLERYGDRIRYLHQQNQERSAARNNGIRHAAGEFLAFLDADDYWTPQKLAKQVALLEAHPDLGLVFSWAAAFHPSGRVLRLLGTDFPQEAANGFDAFEAFSLRTSPPTLTVVARAGCVHRAGLFDEAISEIEDWDLWLRTSLRERAGFVPEVLGYYRLSGAFKPSRLVAAGVPRALPRVVERSFALARAVPGREAVLALEGTARARAHLRAGLLEYAVGKPQAGSADLERAASFDRAMFSGSMEGLVYAVADFALNLYDTWTPPDAASSFLHCLFGKLPASLGHLARLRRQTCRMVAAGHGFRAWLQGEPDLARRCFVRAVAQYPELARNLGIWSISVRSLLKSRADPSAMIELRAQGPGA